MIGEVLWILLFLRIEPIPSFVADMEILRKLENLRCSEMRVDSKEKGESSTEIMEKHGP